MQTDRTAVEKLLEAYSEALQAPDAAALAALYTESGVFMPAGGPVTAGREAIRQRAERFFTDKWVSLFFTMEEVVFEGRFAFVQATSTCKVQQRFSGTEVKERSKDFFVLRKEEQSWEVFRYVFQGV